MSKTKQLSVDQQRRATALQIATGMRAQHTLADALAYYDASIKERLKERLPRPSPTVVAHALAHGTRPLWWAEFHVGMLRAPAREARKKVRRVAPIPEPRTQVEENQAVLYGGGAAAYEEKHPTLADVVDGKVLLGYKRRTVEERYGFVDQWWVRGRDGQGWAEIGRDVVVVYVQPLSLSVTMHRSDREALAQWTLVRDAPSETESVHEGILSQIHDLLWNKENRIEYTDLPRVVRELKDKAQQWDETQKPNGEFVLVPRASFNDLKRQAGVVGNTTFLATPGMQADEQFVLFKTAPADAEAPPGAPKFVRVNNTLFHIDSIRRIEPGGEGCVRLRYEGGTVIAEGTVDEWAAKLAARPR